MATALNARAALLCDLRATLSYQKRHGHRRRQAGFDINGTIFAVVLQNPLRMPVTSKRPRIVKRRERVARYLTNVHGWPDEFKLNVHVEYADRLGLDRFTRIKAIKTAHLTCRR